MWTREKPTEFWYREVRDRDRLGARRCRYCDIKLNIKKCIMQEMDWNNVAYNMEK
jgi:hypothetical protein